LTKLFISDEIAIVHFNSEENAMQKNTLTGGKRSHSLVTGLCGSGILFLLLVVLVPMLGIGWAALIGALVGFPLGYIGANVRGFWAGVKISARENLSAALKLIESSYAWCKAPRPLLYAGVVISLFTGMLSGLVMTLMPHSAYPVLLYTTSCLMSFLIVMMYADMIILNLIKPYVHRKYVGACSKKIDCDKIDFGEMVWMEEIARLILADSPMLKTPYKRVKDNAWNNLYTCGNGTSYLFTVLPLNRAMLKFVSHVFVQPWITLSVFLVKLPFVLLLFIGKAILWIFTKPPVALWKFACRTIRLVHSDIRTACGLDVLAGGFSAYAIYHNLLSSGWIAESQLMLALATLGAMSLGLLFAHISCELVNIFKKLSSIELELT
jgi:hypothetical protein